MNFKFRKILLWVFVGLLSLGQLQRIEFGGNFNGVNIYFHDIFIFLWLLGFSFIYTFRGATSTENHSCRKFIKKMLADFKLELLFVGIAIFGIVLNLILNQDFISILYLGRLISYILFSLSLRYLIKNKQLKNTDLRFKLFGAGAIILFLGFLQLLLVEDTRFLAILGWDDHFHRFISTIFDPGFTGIILIISYLYFLSLKEIANNKIANTLITLSFFLGIALTFSRATYLALVVALIMLGVAPSRAQVKKIDIPKILLKIAVFIITVLLIPKPGGEGVDLLRTSSIDARKSTLQYELSLLKPKTLLIGNGLFSKENSLEKHPTIPSHSRMPDNIFINILLSTGVFGTVIALFLVIKWTTKIVRVSPEIGSAITATLIHSQFNNSILQPFVLLMLLGGVVSLKPKSLELEVKS